MHIIYSLFQLNIKINLEKLEIEYEFFFYKVIAFGLKITKIEKKFRTEIWFYHKWEWMKSNDLDELNILFKCYLKNMFKINENH